MGALFWTAVISWTRGCLHCRVGQYACGTRVPTSLTSTLLSQNPQCPWNRMTVHVLGRETGARTSVFARSDTRNSARRRQAMITAPPLPVHGFWLRRPILSGAAKQMTRSSESLRTTHATNPARTCFVKTPRTPPTVTGSTVQRSLQISTVPQGSTSSRYG